MGILISPLPIRSLLQLIDAKGRLDDQTIIDAKTLKMSSHK